jgi:hypothetical protein
MRSCNEALWGERSGRDCQSISVGLTVGRLAFQNCKMHQNALSSFSMREADPDIQILKEAKAGYAKLQ